MSNKNIFYGNWKNFVEKQKLQEVTEEVVDAIARATKYAEEHPEYLPFGSVFGNQLRVVQPFKQKNVKKVLAVLTFIANNQQSLWVQSEYRAYSTTIDAEKKTVSMKQKPLGWKEGDPIPQVSKEIVDILVTIPKLSKNPTTGEESVRMNKLNVINALKETSKTLIKNYQEQEKQNYHQDTLKGLKQSLDYNVELSKKMQDWWQKNQARFILDPELLTYAVTAIQTRDTSVLPSDFESSSDSEMGDVSTEYSIIYSRAPIDVVRMSDFEDEGIESCHSQGNSYFHCAIADAQNEGAIAFVVRTEDLEDVDLTETEIFRDPQRRVTGIVPVARIRLRNLTVASQTEQDKSIAVPELRTYGDKLDGFVGVVEDFLADKQSKLLVSEENGTKKLNISTQITDYTRRGGSYQDNPIGSRFNTLIKKISSKEGVEITSEQSTFLNSLIYSGHIRNVSSEDAYRSFTDDDEDNEEEMHREAEEDEYNRGIRAVTRNTDFRDTGCEFDWNWGEDYATITSSFSVSFVFSTEILTNTALEFLTNSDTDLNRFSDNLIEYVKESDVFSSPYMKLEGVYPSYASGALKITIEYGERYNDAEDFRTHCRDLIDSFQDVDLEEELKTILISSNIIKGDISDVDSPTQSFARLVDWAEDESEHFDAVGDPRTGKLVVKYKPFNYHGANYKHDGWFLGTFTKTEIKYLFTSPDANKTAATPDEELHLSPYYTIDAGHQLVQRIEKRINPRGEKSKQQTFSFVKDSDEENNDSIYFFSPAIELSATPNITGSFTTRKEQYWNIHAKVQFIYNFREHPEQIKNAWNFFEKIDAEPEYLLDLMKEELVDLLKSYHPPKEFVSRGEAEQQKSNQELTENRKRIIKERLMKWYKANKGIK